LLDPSPPQLRSLPRLSHAVGETHIGAQYRGAVPWSPSADLRETLKFYLTCMNGEEVRRKASEKGASLANSKAQIDPEVSPLRLPDCIGAAQAGLLRVASGRFLCKRNEANIDKFVKDLVTRSCISG